MEGIPSCAPRSVGSFRIAEPLASNRLPTSSLLSKIKNNEFRENDAEQASSHEVLKVIFQNSKGEVNLQIFSFGLPNSFSRTLVWRKNSRESTKNKNKSTFSGPLEYTKRSLEKCGVKRRRIWCQTADFRLIECVWWEKEGKDAEFRC